ncbi:leucine-rich colipase-like protein 1 [Neophocaena asiaeorientalis asiaeorientalis]|uniref:Leucine-rich colipase-like protein 1 n=1 Tax=Neophocaena asiaeorientalis asiaeorientalis TaxID=1706337 RepID=A0A341AYV8_NEOAA|nr:leucine-rich colipase-like protein 1 [Neophocaena asiaeorientalis asiaeorientalis]
MFQQCQAGEPSLQGGGAHGAAAGTGGGALTRQGIGEACEAYSECQRGGCVTNSLSPQKFCSPQAVFQQCLSWQKVCPARAGEGREAGEGGPWEGGPGAWQKGPGLLFPQPNGHTCLDHTECRSGCCVTSSFGLQTYCMAKSIFLQCVPWRKPNGGRCTDHGECRSKCYIQPNEVGPHRCIPRSGVLVQCLPW